MTTCSGNLNLLSDLMEMDVLTTKKVGFAEILKVDENTFTIKSINEDEFIKSIPNEKLVDECRIKTDSEES